VFRESVDSIVITDNERNILMANPAMTRIYGYETDEIIGLKPGFFYADPEEFNRQGNIRYSKRSAEMHEPYEVRYKRKNGEPLISETVGTQFRGVDGKVLGYIAVSRDITDRKNAESDLIMAKEKAEYANRAKSEFLANMSHELRTPLNSIIGFSEMMLHGVMGTVKPDNYHKYLELINESGSHLLSLISDILDISKVEAGETALEVEDLDVFETVTNCVEMIRGRSKSAGVQISAEIADGLPILKADKRKVKQILINLLANSLKFTPAGGSVMVSVDPGAGDGVVFVVADTGIGIPEEHIPTIMEPFTQVHMDNHVAAVEGSGLGLSIVKSMAELHGGCVVVASKVGVGTRVTVEIPNSDA
jgi:PAS domain S-box-containing protein